MILLIGCKGSMGKRYEAILNFLNIDFIGIDKGDKIPNKKFTGCIIATPTNTHFKTLKRVSKKIKKVMIEKPWAKTMNEVMDIVDHCKAQNVQLSMMRQYDYLIDKNSVGRSYYDYFRHGSDGIFWDCMQIIGNAKGDVILKESSPIWLCSINGHLLNIQDMDKAYVCAVNDWIKGKKQCVTTNIKMHKKVIKHLKELENYE